MIRARAILRRVDILRIGSRLRRRPDGEHQTAINRLVLGPGMMLYLSLVSDDPHGMPVLIAYVAAGLIVFGLVLFSTKVDHWRRGVMLAIDLATVSWVLHVNGEDGAACYPLYLWTIFGYGFRYGLAYLYVAGAVSIAGFGLVAASTPFWQALPALSCSLLFGIVALPLYAGTLIRKLSTARRAAEAASRAKSYFLASVSHELRTPLTAVIGLSEHIAESGGAAEDRETARTIVSAGRGLLSQINQLLDFSRLEAGGVTVRHDAFDLIPLLTDVRDLMRHAANEKGLTLALHVRPGTPLKMRGDEERLRDILINLIGNALKFTLQGLVTIVADSFVAGGETYLRLAVADTGIGVAVDAQEKIFGSFVQADDSIIDRFGGTGLGLAICKQLAERLGGRIWVESAPGEGSRFTFTARVTPLADDAMVPDRVLLLGAVANQQARLAAALSPEILFEPIADVAAVAFAAGNSRTVLVTDLESVGTVPDAGARDLPIVIIRAGGGDDVIVERAGLTAITPDADAEAIRSAFAIAASQAPLRAPPVDEGRRAPEPSAIRRVLVADDNPMNRKVFAMVLGRAGHVVELVENGEQALDQMKGHGFDVVLMDVNMPVMNGIEAIKLYRFAALGQRRVPIIAVTADVSSDNIARCLDAGMDACIGKPIDGDELIELIARLTERDAPAPAAILAFSPSATVVPLFAPPASSDVEPALDPKALVELTELGGDDFVDELLDVYREDAALMGGRVRDAVEAGDVKEFRDGTHALRSSAANIGAAKLAELCRHYQRIAQPEFETRGRAHLATLEAELARVARALDERNRQGRRAARGN